MVWRAAFWVLPQVMFTERLKTNGTYSLVSFSVVVLCLCSALLNGWLGIALGHVCPPRNKQKKTRIFPGLAARNSISLGLHFRHFGAYCCDFRGVCVSLWYRLLFVRGFLCCLLLGNMANWVKLGEWFWALFRFHSWVDTGARFSLFLSFLLLPFSRLLVVFAVLKIAFPLCRKFFWLLLDTNYLVLWKLAFYANCIFFLAISVFPPQIDSFL